MAVGAPVFSSFKPTPKNGAWVAGDSSPASWGISTVFSTSHIPLSSAQDGLGEQPLGVHPGGRMVLAPQLRKLKVQRVSALGTKAPEYSPQEQPGGPCARPCFPGEGEAEGAQTLLRPPFAQAGGGGGRVGRNGHRTSAPGTDTFTPRRASAGPLRTSGRSPGAPAPDPSGAETPRRRPHPADVGGGLLSAHPRPRISFTRPLPPGLFPSGTPCDDVKGSARIPPAATWRQALSKKVVAHRARAAPTSRNLGLNRRRHPRRITAAPGVGEGAPGPGRGGEGPERGERRWRPQAFPATPPRTRRAGRWPPTPSPPAPQPLPRRKPGRNFRRRPLPGTAAPCFPPAGRAPAHPAPPRLRDLLPEGGHGGRRPALSCCVGAKQRAAPAWRARGGRARGPRPEPGH
ncbi:uncharacterized protein LOC141579331 [Camelus bactrianus]|uniref:Uncharacterized protein LOC141579331 n=1 Tax=Camelus bactrianus TaxID=9837 RepID=A0AC58R7T6_CAMBA